MFNKKTTWIVIVCIFALAFAVWTGLSSKNQLAAKIWIYGNYAAAKTTVIENYIKVRRFSSRLVYGIPVQLPPLANPQTTDRHEIPAPMAMAFDTQNRPYILSANYKDHFGYIYTKRNNKWQRLSFREQLLKKWTDTQMSPERRMMYGSMTIDDHDRLYAIVYKIPWQPVLVFSPDLGGHFYVYELPGNPEWAFLENFTGNNNLINPPLIGLSKKTKEHPARFSEYTKFSVILPRAINNQLDLSSVITISDSANGFSNHSGGYSFAVTTGYKSHITWNGCTANGWSGNPIHVATIDRQKEILLNHRGLIQALPVELDRHVTPVITVDSKGFLHLVTGSHLQPFIYLKSLQPDCIDKGWTEPDTMGFRQTYATLICGEEDNLFCVFREHPNLYFQSKAPHNKSWSKYKELFLPPVDYRKNNEFGYTNYSHKVFIDREANLYVSVSFRTNDKDVQMETRTYISNNQGRTWKYFLPL